MDNTIWSYGSYGSSGPRSLPVRPVPLQTSMPRGSAWPQHMSRGVRHFGGGETTTGSLSPLKKQEIMGFLPILNRYDMGCPSGKTYIYISCVYFWGESHPCLRTKVKTILSLFAPHLFACTNGCVSQYIPEQIYEYGIYI